MSIRRPQRVFLDSWVLKHLARGQHEECLRIIRTLVNRGDITLVVTWDHIEDFCRDEDQSRAEREAGFVDSLHPLWMLSGFGIYHREAYSEFRRLTGERPLDDPFPCQGPMEAVLQWFRDCPCDDRVASLGAHAATYDRDATYRREVCYIYQGIELGLGEGHEHTLSLRQVINANRVWARDWGVNWDKYFRTTWIKHLTESPSILDKDQVESVAAGAELERMPAWAAMFAVQRVWHGDKGCNPKPSDIIDLGHLAVGAYVDVFVTERHLASMIRRAKLRTPFARVFNSVATWVDSLSE